MTTYKDIPLATDQRNVSQADIRNNFAYLMPAPAISATGILPVDHYATGDNTLNPTDGFHKQISFLNRTTPANLTNAVNGQNSNGITYTLNDAVPNPQLHFYNGVNDFQITPCLPMRAYANFSVIAGVVTINASFNVTSITRNSTGNYTVIFPQILPSANYVISINGSTPTTGILVASMNTGTFPTNNVVLVFGQLNASSVDPRVACFKIEGG